MIWNIDTTHSHVDFSVRHMGFSTVRGRFREFSGFVETDENNRPQRLEVTIETASIDTGVADRDNHLRSPDFFDAATNPQITFKSTSITNKGGNRYEVTGDLDMHGVVKPVTFEVEAADPINDPYGLKRAAASGSAATTPSRSGAPDDAARRHLAGCRLALPRRGQRRGQAGADRWFAAVDPR